MSKSVTRESVERALNHHRDSGTITSWHRTDKGAYMLDTPALWVGEGMIEFRTLREVHAFLHGVMAHTRASERAAKSAA